MCDNITLIPVVYDCGHVESIPSPCLDPDGSLLAIYQEDGLPFEFDGLCFDCMQEFYQQHKAMAAGI